MPRSPSEITPERLDATIEAWETGRFPTTLVADTLAALRAYREVLVSLPTEGTDEYARREQLTDRLTWPQPSRADLDTAIALIHRHAIYPPIVEDCATAPAEAEETRLVADCDGSSPRWVRRSTEAQETRATESDGEPRVCTCPHCKAPKGSGLLFQHWSKDPAVPYYHCQCATCLSIAPA